MLCLVVHVVFKLCHTLFRSFRFRKYMLQMSHIHVYLKEQHRLSMKAIFHRQDVSVWLPTGQAEVFATKLCLSLWILSVIVWLLDTVVSSKHLTSILESVILRLLRNNWFEIKRMCTTVCTRRSFSPLLQFGIGTPGYEATSIPTKLVCPLVRSQFCLPRASQERQLDMNMSLI